jgi:acyl-coenzyme A thioesterase PaaI-like protein
MAENFRRDNFCFVCGADNPKGMHLSFHKRGEEVYSRFSLPEHYQGYTGVIHGGVISLILDEAMAHLQGYSERFLTAKITVRFFSPLRAGEEVEVKAVVKESRKRFKVTTAEMRKVADGAKVAFAQAIMFVYKEEE